MPTPLSVFRERGTRPPAVRDQPTNPAVVPAPGMTSLTRTWRFRHWNIRVASQEVPAATRVGFSDGPSAWVSSAKARAASVPKITGPSPSAAGASDDTLSGGPAGGESVVPVPAGAGGVTPPASDEAAGP